MELIKTEWKVSDIDEFQNYLKSFKKIEKRYCSSNILKTKLPILCIKTSDMKRIVNSIYRGNYLSFLDLMMWDYYENTVINGYLINRIKDFNTVKKYLDIYSKKAECWATCDLLSFNIKNNEDNYYNLMLEYIRSDKLFVRRIGLLILFEFIDQEKYLSDIFNIINSFYDEKEYYVNMMSAGILSECFIKYRDETIKFLDNNNLNSYIINKTVQKCRESKRVTLEDKEMLLKYKYKTNCKWSYYKAN